MAVTPHRVFTAPELATFGLTPRLVDDQVRAGLLVPGRRPRTWRVPDPASWATTLRSAMSGAGSAAVVLGRADAALLELDGFVPTDEGFTGLVEIGVPRGRNARPGVQRVELDASDIVEVDGLRGLSAARLLAELGRAAGPDLVERALECALRRGLVTEEQVRDPTFAHGRRGARVFREVIGRRPPGAAPTESDAETRCVQVIRSGGLPTPARQFPVDVGGHRYRLDLAWPELRVVVEVDSRRWHGDGITRADVDRQNVVSIRGWTIVRVTWHQIVFEPDHVRSMIAFALEAAALRACRRPWAV